MINIAQLCPIILDKPHRPGGPGENLVYLFIRVNIGCNKIIIYRILHFSERISPREAKA